jgi:hypothetical protein
MSQDLTVVGNLIGAQTVEATPKVSGRLESVSVRLDKVTRGERSPRSRTAKSSSR